MKIIHVYTVSSKVLNVAGMHQKHLKITVKNKTCERIFMQKNSGYYVYLHGQKIKN